MRCILLYRLIFSATPQVLLCSSSNLNFPFFSLIHLDRIPQAASCIALLLSECSFFSSLILPPCPTSFIFSLTPLLQSCCSDSSGNILLRIVIMECFCLPTLIRVSFPLNGTWDPKVASASVNLFSLLWVYSMLKVWNSYSNLCAQVL